MSNLLLDGSKVGWYPERIAAWERGERIAPITMDVAMTRACNAACNFCYASLQANEGYKISKEHFDAFLEDAADIGVKGVSYISDGESTVVPWYVDAVEYGSKLGLKIGAGSNGIKLTRDVMEKILPHLSYLRINFSAGERKRYAEIMGVKQENFDLVIQNIKDGMEIIRRDGLPCTLNMQLVCDPKDSDQILPFAKLAKELQPSYSIIKHCADNIEGTLGVDYTQYEKINGLLKEAESMGTVIKWSRIANEGKREYSKCFGPPFIMQVSGSGLVAPCGFLFNEKYKAFHIGNITEKRFKDIWASDRYWDVMKYLASEHFNPQKRCGPNCLQDRTNDFLFKYKTDQVALPTGEAPENIAFI